MGVTRGVTGPQEYGWLDNPAWGSTLVWLLGAVLVIRLLTLGVLGAAQRGHRLRTVSRGRRREILRRFAKDASQRQYALRGLRQAYPAHRLCSALDPLLCLLVVGGITLALHLSVTHHYTDAKDVLDVHRFRFSPPWPVSSLLPALKGTDPGGAAAVALAGGLGLAWLGIWFRTRFLLLCSNMPSGTWERSALRRRLLPHLALRLLAVLLLLPVAGLALLLAWQTVALLRARTLHRGLPIREPLPVIGQPVVVEQPPGATRRAWDSARAAGAAKTRAVREARAARAARAAKEAAATALAARAAAQAQALREARDAEIAREVIARSRALREQKEAREAAERAAAAADAAAASAGARAAAEAEPVTVVMADGSAERTTVARPRGGATTPDAPAIACRPLRGTDPRTIGSYRLLGTIGAGGMGTVYLACRQGSATQVALKTLRPELLDEPVLLERFRREAEMLERVPGAHTARVLDTGTAEDVPYIAMELLDGRPLDAHLREHGPIRSPEALRSLALALAVALDAVHRSSLVHRDLKPANIMLTSDGPKLLDFGIATMVDRTRLTMAGGGPGTLTYMAPEQFGDEPVGPAADLWAWGCCVVAAAHGSSPFAAQNTMAVIRKIVELGPAPEAMLAVRAADATLALAVERALSREPGDRQACAGALVEYLRAGGPERPSVDEQITRGWQALRL
ncbi:serine/threonine-protein kinase [Kitasatospora sp. NPDC050543]|uniref:serine/threonine-protein kinase n=1 Tax=Kitasatospora sp. NPDC050543 TaxID=3364054 RepID=UPI00379691B0